MTDNDNDFDKPSKSQRKRDMESLKQLADRLTQLSHDQLLGVEDPDIRHAVEAAKKITKGNARKRQIQYIAKLMSRIDVTPIREIIDTMDASSIAYVQKFHRLESWRERLIEDDAEVMGEIFEVYPACDRQQLRHMTKSAVKERKQGQQQLHYRKLFQFLKALDTDEDNLT